MIRPPRIVDKQLVCPARNPQGKQPGAGCNPRRRGVPGPAVEDVAGQLVRPNRIGRPTGQPLSLGPDLVADAERFIDRRPRAMKLRSLPARSSLSRRGAGSRPEAGPSAGEFAIGPHRATAAGAEDVPSSGWRAQCVGSAPLPSSCSFQPLPAEGSVAAARAASCRAASRARCLGESRTSSV